jgi:cell division protein FtsQ
LQPPKNRYSQTPNRNAKKPAVKAVKAQKVKPKRISNLADLAQRRLTNKEARRFTKESNVRKVFFRSIAFSLVSLVVLVLATMFTPLLSIDKITVTGTSKVSNKQVLALLKNRIGTPLPMISEASVAEDLAQFKLIESISLISKPPHALEVRITERTPISLVVRGGTRFLYDPAGVNLGVASGYELLPTIIVSDDPKSSKSYAQAIDVLLALPAQLLKRVAYIQAKTRDNVTLQLRGNSAQTIIWGDSSQSILKSKVLKTLLVKTSTRGRATFDVSSPLNPSVIR